jgi:hypothetical protein
MVTTDDLVSMMVLVSPHAWHMNVFNSGSVPKLGMVRAITIMPPQRAQARGL